MSEARVLTGVFVVTDDEAVRYQFVALNHSSALLRREVCEEGVWLDVDVFAICPLDRLVINGRGIELERGPWLQELKGLGLLRPRDVPLRLLRAEG